MTFGGITVRTMLARVLFGGMACLVLMPEASRAATRGKQVYEYLSPVPGSSLVSPSNNIVIRLGSPLDPAQFNAADVSVVGNRSGIHQGTLALAADTKTLVWVPAQPFAPGERVAVRLRSGLTTRNGEQLPPLSFEFVVAMVDPARAPRLWREYSQDAPPGQSATVGSDAPVVSRSYAPARIAEACDSLPAVFPPLSLLKFDDPEAGGLFLTPNPPNGGGNLLILDSNFEPMFYRRMPGGVADFKLQPNGLLTYFNRSTSKFYALDSSYALVDSFATGNGYVTDLHDLQILPNGNALIMAYDPQPVGMDTVVTGGNPAAIVTGLIIQEIDAAKNVVFQWRSWDYFKITDGVACMVNLLGAQIDYSHGNAIELDHDGNLLISSRHMNEITKIDRQTGDIIWRLGLNSHHNDFTFVDDARGFSAQHDIRRLPNGHITLFDNGNCQSPQYSRALEYDLDETNKVATLKWEYRSTPDIYGFATGNVQRLSSGSTLINWGFAAMVTELDPLGNKELEFGFGVVNMITYRAFRFPWKTNVFSKVNSLNFGDRYYGSGASLPVTIRNPGDSQMTITCLAISNPAFTWIEPPPLAIPPGDSTTLHVGFDPTLVGEFAGSLNVRSIGATGVIAETVVLTGNSLGPAPPLPPAFALAGVIPTPSQGPTGVEFTLPTPARIRLSIMDIQGRVVTVLADRDFDAGRHRLDWDGRHNGRRIPAGVYLVHYEWPGGSTSRRLVLLP